MNIYKRTHEGVETFVMELPDHPESDETSIWCLIAFKRDDGKWSHKLGSRHLVPRSELVLVDEI